MTELIKKYLVTKWWLPLLLFGISIILFASDTILPKKDFGFYNLLFFGVVLLISMVWQFFEGKIAIGLFQLSILVTPFLILGFMFYLVAKMMNKPDEELALEGIEPLIKEKTDLNIPNNFEVLENLIEHTEGALDSDYSIGLTIKYQESDEENIIAQIRKNIESKSVKGTWKNHEYGFDFNHSDNDMNRAEPFYFKVDTLKNTMELNLSHL